MILVNLGCGNKFHPDWINLNYYKTGEDVIIHDLNQPLPFESKSVDVVYHSHVLEHFTRDSGIKFLTECRRVLKENGIIRIVVPNLEEIVKEYLSNLELARKGEENGISNYNWILLELFDQVQRNYSGGEMLKYWKQIPLPGEEYIISRVGSEVKNLLDNIRKSKSSFQNNEKLSFLRLIQDKILKWMGYSREMAEIGKFRLSGEVHYWMYDEYSLKKILIDLGFKSPKKLSAFESNINNFNKYFLDIESNGMIRKPDSLFIEAKC